jgi:hypothetical protein
MFDWKIISYLFFRVAGACYLHYMKKEKIITLQIGAEEMALMTTPSTPLQLDDKELLKLIKNEDVDWPAYYNVEVKITRPLGLSGKHKTVQFYIWDKGMTDVCNRFENRPEYKKHSTCSLTPFQVAVYDRCMGAELAGDYEAMQVCFDIYREFWPDEYKKLLA